MASLTNDVARKPDALPPRREGQPAPAELIAYRAAVAAMVWPFAPVAGISRERHMLAGVECLVIAPSDAVTTMLYFHGGGFRIGSPDGSAPFLAHLSAAARARVIAVKYGLAPEVPFPGALHDVLAVYRAVLDEGARDVVFAGDSAGAALALSLALAVRGVELPMPSGLVLLSPLIDFTLSGDSYRTRAETDLLFSHASAVEIAAHFLQGADPRHPLASPLFADLSGLPPVQLFVGGAEVLLDENVALAAALARADVALEFHVAPGTQHVWPTLYPDLPQSKAAMDAIAGFTERLAMAAYH